MVKRNFMFKQVVCLFIMVLLIATSIIAVSASSYNKKSSINGVTVSSTAYAQRTSAQISSTLYSGAGSVTGNHTMTYRAQATASSNMEVQPSVRESFGGSGGIITRTGLYLVDYTEGNHVYTVSGDTLTVNTHVDFN